MNITRASDHSVLFTIAQEISPEVQRRVWRLARAFGDAPVRNLHPGYGSLLVSFDPLSVSHKDIGELGRTVDLDEALDVPSKRVEIPVCYGGGFGPDLADVARISGVSAAEVIRIHCEPEYLVYFLGFSAGFPYLGGMSERIAAPRLAQPRTHVPPGSVGIAGVQTGIYPHASPGGWRIIGRTPLRLFRPEFDEPTLVAMGDRIRFVPIREDEFESRAHSR